MRADAIVDQMGRELRQAARRLVRTPIFTLAIVLTLALAIGANVAIFAIVNRVVLNPLPYADSGRLIAVEHGMPSRNIPSGLDLTSRLYYQYLERASTLDGLAIYRSDELTLTGAGVPERIRVARTTPSLAPVLRVSPEQGRWFTEQEGTPAGAPVAVLSHGLWVRRYGEDRSILGRLVTLDGVPTTVVGVMRSSYAFPDPGVDAWIPEPLAPATALDSFSYAAVARLRDAATVADSRVELTRAAADLGRASPGNGYESLVSTATTLIDATVGPVATRLWILLASVGLVLLVACANVANLFLVRSEARQREIAVRRALGAGRGRIAGYFLTESLLLSVAGGAVGLGLARGAVDLLVAFGPASLPRLHEVRLDGVALAFAFALSLVSGVVFGSIPLMRLGRLAVPLHESGRANTATRGRHRARHLLMGGQIALALLLLVSSGLMLRSFQKLRAVDPGFDATSALTFRVGLPRRDYPDREAMAAAHHAILNRLSALPGVSAVSAATCLPLSERGFCHGVPVFVEGRPVPVGTLPPIAAVRAVAGRYLEVMGIRLVRGRGIEARDLDDNAAVVVVNEALARVSFPNQNPIGQRIRLGNPPGLAPIWFTIAGVASNTPTRALAEPNRQPKAYIPMLTNLNVGPPIDAMSFVMRTVPPAITVTQAARRAIADVDGGLALAQVQTLQTILDRAAAQMAFTMVLIVIAASVALLLGVIGIYGATSYIVSQRTREIGVRLALGATPGSVAAAIVRQGGMVALAGIAIGLTGAFAGSRLIGSLLYGVSPRDPAVFSATALILLVVALAACWVPARRAARLTPLEALRAE